MRTDARDAFLAAVGHGFPAVVGSDVHRERDVCDAGVGSAFHAVARVPYRRTGRIDERWRDEIRDAAAHYDFPLRMVHDLVMCEAQQHEVVQLGFPTETPKAYVVTFAPMRLAIAPREGATDIAQDQRAA